VIYTPIFVTICARSEVVKGCNVIKVNVNVPRAARLSLYTSLLSEGLVLTVLGSAIFFAVLSINLQLGLGLFAGIVMLNVLSWRGFITTNRNIYSIFLVYVFLVLVWCLMVSSQQTSDFGVYYSCRIVDSFTSWIHKCQSAWVLQNPTFWRRSLLYSLPIGTLFGKSYFGFKLANFILHICAVGFIYVLVNRYLGRRAGLFSAAFLAFYPEFWFVSSLAVSDNLVILLIIIWFGLLVRCINVGTRIWHIIATAFLVIALDLLRDIGPICLVTMAILAISFTSAARRKLLMLVFLTLLAWLMSGFIVAHFVDTTAKTTGLLSRVVGSGVIKSHDWLSMYFWSQYVYPLVDPQSENHLRFGLLALNLSHGIMVALSNWWVKISILFAGYGYYYFSSAPVDDNPDTFIGLVGTPFYHATPAMEFFFSGITAGLLIIAFAGAITAGRYIIGRISLAFCSAFFLLIIGLAEVQPRYSLLLAPALGILAAHLIAHRTSSVAQIFSFAVKSAGIFIVSLLTFLLAITTAARAYVADFSIMTSFQQEKPFQYHTEKCNEAHAIVTSSQRSIRIKFPNADATCYSFLVTAKESLHQLNFFFARTPTPPQWKKLQESPYRLQLLTPSDNGYNASSELQLGKQAIVPAKIQFLGNDSHQFRIIITMNGRPSHDIVLDYFYDGEGNPVRFSHK
jgi:hypothetical protein